MRASFRRFIVLSISLFSVVMLVSCKRYYCRNGWDDESVAFAPPPPPSDIVVPPSVDAKQIETRPIEKHPPIQKPIEPRPPENVKPSVVEVKPPVPLPPVRIGKTIRIKAGSARNWKDKDGNEWLADAGFSEGAMVDNGPVKIGNTSNPEIYASEHSNMEKFTWPLPNGKYLVKLHFAENLEDVKKAGDRVFSVDVAGKKLNDLDVFKEAGGFAKAVIKEFHVTITGGKLEINFGKSNKREPMINGIEIIPE